MAGRNHGESSGPRAAQLPQASGALGSLPHPGQTAPPITPTPVCPRPPLQTPDGSQPQCQHRLPTPMVAPRFRACPAALCQVKGSLSNVSFSFFLATFFPSKFQNLKLPFVVRAFHI